MSMDEKEPNLWIDKLSRKHECYMHGDLIDKVIDVDGRAVTMRLPEYLSDIEVCRAAISDKVSLGGCNSMHFRCILQGFREISQSDLIRDIDC